MGDIVLCRSVINFTKFIHPLNYGGSHIFSETHIDSPLKSLFLTLPFLQYRPNKGRAMSQAVRRHVPTAAARIQSQVRQRGICGGQSGTGAGFLRLLPFPLSILIPLTAPHLLINNLIIDAI
jgi:hypothetical protein